jgi:hypothetical protein
VIGHRDGGSGVENALEVGAGEVGDIHLAEHRTDETVAVSRLLLPVPLAPASTPGRAPTRVEVVLDESNTLGPTLCRRDSGRQALDDSCRLLVGLLPGGRRRVPTAMAGGSSLFLGFRAIRSLRLICSGRPGNTYHYFFQLGPAS